MAGFIFYRGASPIDGAPIVAVATLKSANSKTGDMVQTWILREDISPLDAIGSGEDASICGNCAHRGRKGKKRTMVPIASWRMLLAGSAGRTGYTHAWRRMWAQALRPYVMASVDSVAEQDLARAMGWRTFRVRTEAEPLQANEFACPASPEGGNKKQCIDCKACDGGRAGKASAAIIVHGKMAKYFATA